MNQTKHTPLPWKFYTNNAYNTSYILTNETGNQLAQIANFQDREKDINAKENAGFIVLACNSHYDLLESCKTLLKAINARDISDEEMDAFVWQTKEAIKKAEAI